MMASEVLLPKQGNSVESCIIVEWKVSEGDAVSTGDVILEVETDKATMEVESTADGVLLKQLVAEGDDVPVLSPIAVVGEKGEKVDLPASTDESNARKTTDTKAPTVASESDSTDTGSAATSGPAAQTASSGASRRSRGGAKISPRARRLAEQRSVAYEGLSGSGPGGRIMVRDIEAAPAGGVAAAGGAGTGGVAAPSGSTASGGGIAGAGVTHRGAGEARVTGSEQIKGVRKLIAERMHHSLTSTAQLTMDAAADARSVLSYRKRLKASDDERLQSISINDLILFAVSRAVAASPEMNRTFENGTVTHYEGVNLGFAVDGPKGLVVPVIKGADTMSLAELAARAHELAAACQAGNVSPDDLSGGTFTVTNLGAFGIERFTPVLNPPQVGILGVGSVVHRPAPDGEGTIPMMGLSLTIDHQIVDGAPAARFLQQLSRELADFELSLAL